MQKDFWKAYRPWALWVQASGLGAIRVMEALEDKLGAAHPLTVDNFRMVRGLLMDDWRRQLTADAQAKGVNRLPLLQRLAGEVEKAGWVEWHWSAENPLIHAQNRVLPCL